MKQTPLQDRIAQAALTFLAAHPWESLSIPAIAKTAGAPLKQVATYAPTPEALIPLIVALIDRRVAAQCRPDPNASFEDNLFDLWMTRFEILQKWRKGVLALAAPCRRIPVCAWAMFKAQKKSIAELVKLAGPKAHDTIDTVCIFALLFAYQKAFCRWEKDESPDLAATMAALDLTIKTCGKLGFLASQECNAP